MAPIDRLPALCGQVQCQPVSHRHDAASAGTLTGLADDITALRTAIEAVAARVRHHGEQIRQSSEKSSDQPERTPAAMNGLTGQWITPNILAS
jgi:hypothetical protein